MAKRDRQVATLAQVFRVLGDPTRLRIWMTLQGGETNVTRLCKKLKMPQPTVSHHLGILRMNGLVTNRRSGKEIFYSRNSLDTGISGRALRSMLDGSRPVRVGPLVFGVARR